MSIPATTRRPSPRHQALVWTAGLALYALVTFFLAGSMVPTIEYAKPSPGMIAATLAQERAGH